MLKMPMEGPSAKHPQQPQQQQQQQMNVPTGDVGNNFMFGNSQIMMNYAQPNRPPNASLAIATSPLDQLIKLHERFQQGEFCSSSSIPASSCVPAANSSFSSATVKTPPAVANLAMATSADFPSNGVPFSPQSLLDPSSLVFSSYSAANVAQLAPMAAAAAVATNPWTLPNCWSSWGAAAAATETAALLNGTGGEGIGGSHGRDGGGGGRGGEEGVTWGTINTTGTGGNYLGTAFGGLLSVTPSSSTVTPRSSLDSTKGAEKKNWTASQKQQRSTHNNNSKKKTTTALGNANLATSNGGVNKGRSGQQLHQQKQLATEQRPNGGGKIRPTAGGSNNSGTNNSSLAAAKSTCECPNCKELQRIGAPLDKKREKHSCHIPGCHKVYSRSSHLKAHLRWHSTDRPATTKKRLFDPPNGPLIIGSLIGIGSNKGSGTIQTENR